MLAEKQRRMGDTLLPVDVDSLKVEFINNLSEAEWFRTLAHRFKKHWSNAWRKA
jgi:hypothetical protein